MSFKKKNFIHESSYVDDDVKIGTDSKIWHFSHVQSGARIGANTTIGQNVNIGNNVIIGNNVKIQNNVSVYEGVEIEDYVFLLSIVFTNVLIPRSEFPQRGSDFYEKTLLKKSCSIGANATIICGVTIGRYALIGAGAVVTKNIPDFALIIGNPGRLVGWVNKKGEKLNFDNLGKSDCEKFLMKEGLVLKFNLHIIPKLGMIE